MKNKPTPLPITKRLMPQIPAWQDENAFLLEAGANSVKTESAYRGALRFFADWVQQNRRTGYDLYETWPLAPDRLTAGTVLEFRRWLLDNRARATATSYTAAVMGYLYHLDGRDRLPPGLKIEKLQRQLNRGSIRPNQAQHVGDLDVVRQDMPRIVEYYDRMPLPPKNDPYNGYLTLLRDRALVNVLYSTAARISEVVSLDRAGLESNQNHTIDRRINRYVLVVGKRNKGRTLYVQDYARGAIADYLAERTDRNPALFVSHSRNSLNARLQIRTVHEVIKRAVRALNLDKRLSAHDFRHYRATQLLRAGVPLEVIQEILGHASIGTTRNIYAPLLGIGVVSDWLDRVETTPEEALDQLEASERELVGGLDDLSVPF
jgi:site-specific recombinase XerD